jgi:hypothetical protein
MAPTCSSSAPQARSRRDTWAGGAPVSDAVQRRATQSDVGRREQRTTYGAQARAELRRTADGRRRSDDELVEDGEAFGRRGANSGETPRMADWRGRGHWGVARASSGAVASTPARSEGKRGELGMAWRARGRGRAWGRRERSGLGRFYRGERGEERASQGEKWRPFKRH